MIFLVRNLKEISYHISTNDPSWIIELSLFYDMSQFLEEFKNLVWFEFNLMQQFLKGLSIIFDDEDNHVKSFSQPVSAYYMLLKIDQRQTHKNINKY
jgi:hypothetical protein